MLGKSAYASFRWNLAGLIARQGAAFLINIILARILGPEPYGLVALALIFITIGNIILDPGLSAGLVQKKEIDNKDVYYVFTIQVLLTLIICGLIICLAPLIARFYNKLEIIPVMQILSIGLFFQSLVQIPIALLKRRMAFDRIQQASIASYLVGYMVIGLPLAYLNYGVWSLVFAHLAQAVLYLIFVFAAAPHSLRFNFRDPGELSLFGMNILGANIANWVIGNYDNTSIGLAYGTTSLGLYSRAWNLAMTPVGIVVSACQGVLFSTSSKLQEYLGRARDGLLGVFCFIGITLFPFSICESIIANDLVQFIYGDKWVTSAPILAVLALAMPFFALMAIQGPVLAGLGKPQIEIRLQWIVVAFTCVVFYFAIRSSLQMIVWSVIVIYIFRFLLLSIVNLKTLGVTKKEILKILLSIVIFSVTEILIALLVGQLTIHLMVFYRLLIQSLAGLFGWVMVFMIGWNHFLPSQIKSLMDRFMPTRIVVILDKI
jgi:O-antigen/teichoic acid export membrane protein